MSTIPSLSAPTEVLPVSRDDLPPHDAPEPPLTDYIDLSLAARQMLSGGGVPPPEAPLTYRSLSSIRMKAPVPIEPPSSVAADPGSVDTG